MDFSRNDYEINVVVGDASREFLSDTCKFQEGIFRQILPFMSRLWITLRVYSGTKKEVFPLKAIFLVKR